MFEFERIELSLASERTMWLGRELNPRHEDFQSSALPTELPSRSGKSEKSNVEGRSEFRTPGCHYGGFSFLGKGQSTNSRGGGGGGEERWREARCRFPEGVVNINRNFAPPGTDSAVPSIRRGKADSSAPVAGKISRQIDRLVGKP